MTKKIYKFQSPAVYSWNAREYSKSTMLTWAKKVRKAHKIKITFEAK